MSRLARTLAATATAVAGTLALVTPAQAAPVVVCREVSSGYRSLASLCAGYDVGFDGTTVTPTIYWGCTIGDNLACTGEPIGGGRTGFVPNAAYPLPTVHAASGTVVVHPGTIGTFWVNGVRADLVTAGFCVGDPAIC